MTRVLFLLVLLACSGCHRSLPSPPRQPIEPDVAVTTIRKCEFNSVQSLLRDASRDLPHSATGKPWDVVADAFVTNAEKNLSRGTSRSGSSPEQVNLTALIRTVEVGELPFQLVAKISAINQPDSIVTKCAVSLELTRSFDTADYINRTAVPTNTVLDDVFKTDAFLQCCRDYPEISFVSIRFQPISHGRQEHFTQGFLVHVGFRDDENRTSSSLTFRSESGLEPAVNYNGNPVSTDPFIEADTWLPPEKVGEGSGSWQPNG